MDTTLKLPAELQNGVDEAVAQAVGERWASRIWASDTSLWTDDPEVADKIKHRLGWLYAPTFFQDEAAELTAFGEEMVREGFTDVLVCGMGGSSLAPEVLTRVYPESDKGLNVHVLDSTDPAAVAAYDEGLDPARTVRIIATKSGSTTETLAFFAHLWDKEQHRVGRCVRHPLRTHGERCDRTRHHFERIKNRPDGVEKGLFVLLEIAIVRQRQSFENREQRDEISDRTSRFTADEFGNVGILFLGH